MRKHFIRTELLRKMFAEIGEGCYIEPPLHANWGVVTKDLPSGVLAVGNPCRILRAISDHDRQYYFKNKKIPDDIL